MLDVPILGVPSGVKMHSAVFATSPASAAAATIAWLASSDRRTREAEVVDVDEAAVRADRMEVRFYGTVRVPDVPGRLQALKASGARAEVDELRALALEVLRRLEPGTILLLGPGTTTRAIASALGVEGSLLGIDVVELGPGWGVGRLIERDANEAAILAAVKGRTATAVLSPTGGQGFLLGRGNQQLSPAVLRAIGPDRVLVVATPSKLAALAAGNLYVDTGDAALDKAFAGYRRVLTGPGQESVVRIVAA